MKVSVEISEFRNNDGVFFTIVLYNNSKWISLKQYSGKTHDEIYKAFVSSNKYADELADLFNVEVYDRTNWPAKPPRNVP